MIFWFDAYGNRQKKQKKQNEENVTIAMEVLHELFVQFPQTKDFVDEKLEQKSSNEDISEVINFSLTSL